MSDDQINILFLGGAKRVSLAEYLIEAGDKLKKKINIFSYELDSFVPIAAIGKVIIGLKWDDENIINHLIQTIREQHIHIVLPFVDGATIIASHLKTELPDVFIPVSEEQACEIMFDKIKANEWFKNNNIPVPSNAIEFPVIAKPRRGSASKGLIIIRNDNDWKKFQSNLNSNDYLIQQYLDATEYTVDVYIDKNKTILSVVPRKRMEVLSGEATKTITVRDTEIIELSKHIISLINLEGPVTLQFLRERKTNKLYVMEINPRYGGGVIASIKAGANSCTLLLKEYLNYPLEEINNWQENILMTRAFREFFYHANNN